jgi:hypothetical protein
MPKVQDQQHENSDHLSTWGIVCHRSHQGRLPALHCRQKQGLALPVKQKANEDSATTVKYEAPTFAGRGIFLVSRKQVQFVWHFSLYCFPKKKVICLQIHQWLEASLDANMRR